MIEITKDDIMVNLIFLSPRKKHSVHLNRSHLTNHYEDLFRNRDIKTFIFLDFGNQSNFPDKDGRITYSDMIEQRQTFRKNTPAVYFYRYNGHPIECGYWKYERNLTGDFQKLSISRWGKIIQQLPPPVGLTNLIDEEAKIYYVTNLKLFFNQFMRLLLEEEEHDVELVNQMLEACKSQDSVSDLVTAFTHQSMSYLNYDSYEHRGDRFAISLMSEAFHQKFTNLNKTTATRYALYYNSAKGQCIFADDMDLLDRMIRPNFVKINEDDPEKTETIEKFKSDIYESFIGCIAKIFTRQVFEGSQFLVCFKMISYVVDTLSFDRNILRGDYKTQVLQLLEMSDSELKGSIKLRITKNNIIVTITEELDDFLKNKGSNLSRIITEPTSYDSSRQSKSSAEKAKWKFILEKLHEHNISVDKIKSSIHHDLKIIAQTEEDIFDKFKKRLVREYGHSGNDISQLLARVDFAVERRENYISMGLNVYNFESSGNYYLNSVTPPITWGQREEEVYGGVPAIDLILENAKLVCIPFPNQIPQNCKFKNPKLYGKFLAIKQYVEMGSMVER